MRLTTLEINGIIQAVDEFLAHNKYELRLFGSRVDDHKKGGDIDLLLLIDNLQLIAQLSTQKHLILARIKQLLGDQKIDLKIATFHDISTNDFLRLVYPDSIDLKQIRNT